MKYFKNSINHIYAYDEDQTPIDGLIEISEADAIALSDANQKAEFDLMSYSAKRAISYPPITDYLDGVVKGDQAQIDKYIADCLAVKVKYPKPE